MPVANGVPLVVYAKAYNITATGKVLCKKISPYFKREGEKFCSHLQTPCDYNKVSPAITEGKNGIALCADLFDLYYTDGGLTGKTLVNRLIDRLIKGDKVITTSLPSSGKVTLCDKGDYYVLHLVYANTIVRGSGKGMLEVVEDIVTLSKVGVEIKIPNPQAVLSNGMNVNFEYKNGKVVFDITDFNCYAAIKIVK